MNKSFTHEQTMLVFSYIAYYGIGVPSHDHSAGKTIASDILHALKSWTPIKDQWELVWGPGLFAFQHDLFDDNMMYMVRHRTDRHRYVIGVRGTNPLSLKDWLIEDFEVFKLSPWPYGPGAQRKDLKISKGSAVGLSRLQAMQAAPGTPGEGKTLLEAIQEITAASAASVGGDTVNEKPISFCVTGHSLGGALAPTFALWLQDVLEGQIQVSTTAFAGPSAGNKAFAKYSDERLGDRCIRVANSLDVVPHAWNSRTLKKLYFLYKRHLLFPGPLLAGLFGYMLLSSFRGGYYQIKADTPPVPGPYKHLLYNYFAQALYQHVLGYPEMLGLLNKEGIPVDDLFDLKHVF